MEGVKGKRSLMITVYVIVNKTVLRSSPFYTLFSIFIHLVMPIKPKNRLELKETLKSLNNKIFYLYFKSLVILSIARIRKVISLVKVTTIF